MQCRRGLAMRIPPVCPSVCQTHGLWQNRRKVCPDFDTIRKNIWSSFLTEEWFVGATTSTWNFGSTGPHWSEIADFLLIFARNASAVTPSEKRSINTNRKYTTRFPMSLRWSSYVAPTPRKGDSKRKTADFRLKSHFAWRESATKFFLWKLSAAKL